MRIVEVRVRTVSDGITGWKGKFAAYMVIYNYGSHRFFKKTTPAINRFIENKTPKYVKCAVNYPHYSVIWKPDEKGGTNNA